MKNAVNWMMPTLAYYTWRDYQKRQRADEYRRDNREGIQELKEAVNPIPKPPPNSSPLDQTEAAVKGITSIFKSVQLPFDELREVQ